MEDLYDHRNWEPNYPQELEILLCPPEELQDVLCLDYSVFHRDTPFKFYRHAKDRVVIVCKAKHGEFPFSNIVGYISYLIRTLDRILPSNKGAASSVIYAKIERLCVIPPLRRKCIASSLFHAMKAICEKGSHTPLFIQAEIPKDNASALSFFDSFSFLKCVETPAHYTINSFPAASLLLKLYINGTPPPPLERTAHDKLTQKLSFDVRSKEFINIR